MNKKLLSSTLLIIMISGFAIAGISLSTVRADTNVTGIITQDTKWTLSGSPYTLTGNALVDRGVKLAIQPGVTVNLGSYYIEVDGTLSARGNPTDKITFNGGQITFTTSSGSGCLIENAIINQTFIFSNNPLKIDSSIINGPISVTSSIISNNIVNSDISSRSSVISNNNVKGDIRLGSISPGASSASEESSTVSSNIVEGSIISGSAIGTPQIFNNTVSKGGIACTGYGSIFNNYIYGCQDGIRLYTLRVLGGHLPCYATVKNNLIVNNLHGIKIGLSSVFGPGTECPTILSNTISGNSVGIFLSESLYASTPTILNNNLQNNFNYSFYLDAPNNVDVTYNWWGTTDTQSINQAIYDFKSDFNLGKVTFVPFLTEPNPEAPKIPTSKPIQVSGYSYFSVESNSTVTELFFNSTSSELSFNVTGLSETAGYVKVTIPKSLLSSAQNVKVYFDGSQLNVTITEDVDVWLLSFTYTHSKHQVRVVLAADSVGATFLGIEYWIWIAVVVVIAVAGFAGFLFWRKKRKI